MTIASHKQQVENGEGVYRKDGVQSVEQMKEVIETTNSVKNSENRPEGGTHRNEISIQDFLWMWHQEQKTEWRILKNEIAKV